MKNIQGLASGLSTEVDIVPVTITLPTAARVHAITSNSAKDNASAQTQIETATVVGTITGDGNATVTVTSAGMTGSPKAVSVAVLTDDTPAEVAVKIQAALIADAAIGHPTTGKFVVAVDEADVILVANVAAINDATHNVAVENGTCTGLTDDTTSTATTEGSLADGATAITIEGIDGNFNEVSEIVEPAGTAGVNTVNSYLWFNDMYASGLVTNVGVITATAATDATVSCTISAAAGESQQAYYLSPYTGRKQAVVNLALDTVNATENAITTFRLKMKELYGSWKTKRTIRFIDSVVEPLIPMDITIPPRTFVKVTATASAGTSSVGAFITIE